MNHMHGFNVASHTKVEISEQTPQPRTSMIKEVTDTWNNIKEIQSMRYFVNKITIDRAFWDDPERYVGEWNWDRSLLIRDNASMLPQHYRAIMIHEIIGHAFFQEKILEKSDKLVKFCVLADKHPPITIYIQNGEKEWRGLVENKTTAYANEQHSAVAEIINNAPSYHHITNPPSPELIQLYNALHESN